MPESAAATSDHQIVLTHVFDAPCERVFEAWIDPEQIARCWGPNGFTTTTGGWTRPGGTWRFVMHGPDGTTYDNKIAYGEIVPPERLAYDHGDGGDAAGFNVVVMFEDQDGKTRVTMTSRFSSAAERETAIREFAFIEGSPQMLTRLGAFLTRTS